MKNVAILSLSLVALSGTAGLGLSALHEFNMNVQTSALATPDSLPADSGFVIPDYVPDAAQFAAFAPTLSTPEPEQAATLAPVLVAALDGFDQTIDTASVNAVSRSIETQASDTPDVFVPAVLRSVAAPAQKNRPVAAPTFVAQSSVSFNSPVNVTLFDYVIGVYR